MRDMFPGQWLYDDDTGSVLGKIVLVWPGSVQFKDSRGLSWVISRSWSDLRGVSEFELFVIQTLKNTS